MVRLLLIFTKLLQALLYRIMKAQDDFLNIMIFLLILIILPDHTTGNQLYRFTSLTVKDGLSFFRVRVITQDRCGFIWLGTDNGIDRFDGKNFISFKHNSADPNSLPLNNISFLLPDKSEDRIWIGTRGGLCYVDIKTLQITRIDVGPYNDIRTLAEGNDQILWVGTQYGLLKLNKNTLQYSAYNTSNSNISHNQVRSVYPDDSGNLWVGTFDKLNKLEKDSVNFKTIDLKGDYNPPIQNNLVLTICPFSENSDSLLWIGTETGLCLFNRYTDNYKVYRKSGDKVLSDDKIPAIHLFDSNRIWVGTDFGLNLFNIKNEKAEFYFHNPTDPNSLSNNKVWSIYEDRAGIIWFATDNGVNRLDRNQKPFKYYPVNYELNGRPVGSQINYILIDQMGKYWMATQQGVINYSTSAGIIRTFRHVPGDPASLLAGKTLSLYFDEFGKLWIATNKGVNVWDPGKSNMYSFPADFSPGMGLKSPFICTLVRAKNGSFWIGTWDGGLHKASGNLSDLNNMNFNPVNELISDLIVSDPQALWIAVGSNLYRMDLLTNQLSLIESVQKGVDGSTIYSIAYSSKGSIWLGIKNGLIEYRIHKDQYQFYPVVIGKDIIIISILEDNLSNIWCCSMTNLVKFVTQNKEFEVYFIGKDIPIKGFLPGSCCKSNNGELVFAGQDGFIVFEPEKIKKSDYQPNIVISELYVQNELILPTKEAKDQIILEQNIFCSDKIELKYNQRSIALKFASLHFGDPTGNVFAYKMEGYNPDWNYISCDQSSAAYSNLPSGNYTFKLRGTNNDGVWSENEIALTIRIKPPPWATPGFIILYMVIFLLLLSLVFYFYYMKIRWINQLARIRIEKKRNEEVALTKQRFFTNISHEFRTPLSLILGPTNELLEKNTLGKEDKKYVHLISKNARRLLRLINQLIDFRKLETKNLKLQVSNHEIVGFCYHVYDLFTDQAERKQMKYSFFSNVEKQETWLDSGKMETVLYNLLSNAFNFTPPGGEISVDVNVQKENIEKYPEGYFQIKVSDSGIGISPEEQKEIFDRFYQTKEGEKRMKGSGIGLTLVKEFVELHQGSVIIESSTGSGSVFIITIPLMISRTHQDVIFGDKTDVEFIPESPGYSMDGKEMEEERLDTGKPLILLVEDNPEVIDFIKLSLNFKYEFLIAENGRDGLRMVEEKMPDLIVSDIMMSEMDGLSFCQSIKKNPKTSHIPVILLSARTLDDQQIEGVKSGADAYIPKPFNIKYLDAIIGNLFTRKELLVEYVKMQSILNPAEIEVTSTDEKILKQVITFIESHISDPELSVKSICFATGFTHSFIYRKIKNMTGGTFNELIKDIRIKRASQLLKTKKFTIAEVMVEVGFSNHSYFSKCFRKVYKKSPGKYLNNLNN